jgi:hypothetical protein
MGNPTAEVIQESNDITEHLMDSERERLKACESVIRNGLGTFIEVGRSLAEVRDCRLYRETHKSFEEYCRDVFDISKMRAYQQISGYETVMLLEEKSKQLFTFSELDQEESLLPAQEKNQQKVITPKNEAQTRPLTKLSPDNQIKAWELVLEQLKEGKKLTAALVKKAVREVRGEVVKRVFNENKAEMARNPLISNRLKNLFYAMVEAICEERNGGWKSSKKKEVVSRLEDLIKTAKGID